MGVRFSVAIRACVLSGFLAVAAAAASQPVTPVGGSPFSVVQDSETSITSPDGRFLFTSGPANRIRVLSVSGAAPVQIGDFATSCSVTHGLARNPEGTRLYTVGFGSAFVAVHSVASNGVLSQLETETLSTGSVGNSICYVRSEYGDYVYVNENRNGANFLSCFPVEADGKLGPGQRFATGANATGSGFFSSPRIAANGSKGLLFVLNGASVSEMKVGPGGVPNLLGTFALPSGTTSSGAIATDGDGARVFAGLSNGNVAMWQVGPNGLLAFVRILPMGGFRAIDGMQVHPSGRLLVTVDVVQLGITDLSTGQVLYTRSLSNCTGVEMDRFGKRLYIGTSNGTLPVFDFAREYWVQQPPSAGADAYATDEDSPLSVAAPGVLGNDLDANGDALAAALVSGPEHGTLTLNPDGSFSYLPEANYYGPDRFSYKAVDLEGESAPVEVSIAVRSVNDTPTADAGADRTVEATGPQTPVVLTGAGSDIEGGVTLQWFQGDRLIGEGSAVSVSLPVGTATLTLHVTDGEGAVATDDVNVTVADTTAPQLSGVPSDVIVSATSSRGAVVTFGRPAADDAVDGSLPVSVSPSSGSLFPFGKTLVTVRARDAAGNEAKTSFSVTVAYEWSGLLEPIGKRTLRAGSTVPVRFGLMGASAGIRDAHAVLSITGGGGGSFRYDCDDHVYEYNWCTRGLRPGTYTLTVDLGDGIPRATSVTLK